MSTLEQGGGGVISVQSIGGDQFDAIVFGERQLHRWMAGSNSFVRTRELDAKLEVKPNELVHLVIVYGSDNTISLYRNGVPYAQPYRVDNMVTFEPKKSQVLIGWRHTGAGNGFFNGEIESASLYNQA